MTMCVVYEIPDIYQGRTYAKCYLIIEKWILIIVTRSVYE
jgi:hypothetical protein